MSEEWRRGWHPERIPKRVTDAKVLVIGAGPAGLEAARAAGSRGYEVVLAEAERELGGHLNGIARLSSLAEWLRVRDWRISQIQKMVNVEIFRESRLDAGQVIDFGFDHVIVATGSHWRRDGVGANNFSPIEGHDKAHILTPDDVLSGAEIHSPVVIFDDDPYVIGGALAELLVKNGHVVTLVTPSPLVSSWTQFTLDQPHIHRRLVSLGVEVVLNHNLSMMGETVVELAGMYGEIASCRDASTMVLVTMRSPDDGLIHDLNQRIERGQAPAIRSLTAVGDCLAPCLLSEAVFSGYKAAHDLDAGEAKDLQFRIEQVSASYEPDLP